jgi:hypothetical protein
LAMWLTGVAVNAPADAGAVIDTVLPDAVL